MEFINSIIGIPLGWLMWVLHQFIPNYGLSLILFTILLRAAMFPLGIKQQKNTARMALFNPKLQELQKKYGNNKQKYQEEMMKLYEQEGYNPMSGCVSSLPQIIILFGLIDVVYKPLTYLSRFSKETVTALLDVANRAAPDLGMTEIAANFYQRELNIIRIFQLAPERFSELGTDVVDKLSRIDMNLFGLNLGETPTFALNLMLILPILSGVTALLSSIISQHTMKRNNERGAEIAKSEKQKATDERKRARGEEVKTELPNAMGGTMKTMMYVMPVFSFAIAFSVPSGVVLYWIMSNLLMVAQTVILYKVYTPEKVSLLLEADAKKGKAKRPSAMSRYMQAQQAAAQGTTQADPVPSDAETFVQVEGESISKKELNRRKLAEARRRDAEKYGETYVEVTDKDLE